MSGTTQAAIFRVGEELFALDIRSIREITRLEPITRVPRMPDFVEGVMELRGMIIPVVDLRKRMAAKIENSRQTRIIVTRLGNKPLGLVVDEVTDVWEIDASELRPAPSVGVSFKADFLDGVFKRGDSIVFFVKFEELLSNTERATVGEIAVKQREKKVAKPAASKTGTSSGAKRARGSQ